ncbi:HAMP domain-containing methyl-accepting chemotaxis protein [Cytobacillus sp. IB215665]|uniref:methyl-accepting chemotaxis protein n=1 Tax=Cytobacillus sp. IB215665 TaxID=3097357 RepID=UPI002A0D3E35|nr:HAMP domain-containing methyl-accepting chemotaxis protein [Cytobacillus sp. IB215665]MDX8367002.1 HAMP domain-containing methyl-accepting chemotaxis protein [Cytobacillus sp. IB215665]
MKIKTKLLLSYSSLIIILIILGSYAIVNIAHINENGKNIVDERLVPTSSIGRIAQYASNTRIQMLQALVNEDSSMTAKAKNSMDTVDQMLLYYRENSMTADEKEIFQQLEDDWELFKERVTTNIEFILQGQYEKARDGIALGGDQFDKVEDKIGKLMKLNIDLANDLSLQNNKIYQSTKTLLLIGLVLAIIISFVIALIAGRKITNPLKTISMRVSQIADGELTGEPIKIKTKDELSLLGNDINTMQDNLRVLVNNAAEAGDQLAAAAEELSASTGQSSLATEQMATLTQHSAERVEQQLQGINDISSTIKKVSDNTLEIALNSSDMVEISKKATAASENGSIIVTKVVEQMKMITDIVTDSTSQIFQLDQKSNKISNIIDIITDISEQTNLLALNAAIEAARAGENGKSFAVVADEVRKLAEETKHSASQIASVLHEIQNETRSSVKHMSEGTDKVNEGITLTEEVNVVFSNISQLISDVATKVDEVMGSIQMMAEANEQLVSSSKSVEEMAHSSVLANQESSAASEEQLATTEEITSSAEALSALADTLHNQILKFKTS